MWLVVNAWLMPRLTNPLTLSLSLSLFLKESLWSVTKKDNPWLSWTYWRGFVPRVLSSNRSRLHGQLNQPSTPPKNHPTVIYYLSFSRRFLLEDVQYLICGRRMHPTARSLRMVTTIFQGMSGAWGLYLQYEEVLSGWDDWNPSKNREGVVSRHTHH